VVIQVESSREDGKLRTFVRVILDHDEKEPSRTNEIRQALYHAAVNMPDKMSAVETARLPKLDD